VGTLPSCLLKCRGYHLKHLNVLTLYVIYVNNFAPWKVTYVDK
jgi:hypothetical protein